MLIWHLRGDEQTTRRLNRQHIFTNSAVTDLEVLQRMRGLRQDGIAKLLVGVKTTKEVRATSNL